MQNIPSELIITVKNFINITSFKMKGSSDLGQADICDKTYAFNSSLVRHMTSHTGERPFQCTICEVSFAFEHNFGILLLSEK